MVKRISTRFTAITLFFIMLCTIFSLIVTPAHAAANIAGSGLTGNVGAGAWITQYQGIRISIVDKYGNYALVQDQYNSVDLLSSRTTSSGKTIDLTKIDIFYGGTRALEHSIDGFTYRATGSEGDNQALLNAAAKAIKSKIFYVESYHMFITNGSSNNIYQVIAPVDERDKILKLSTKDYRPLEYVNEKFKLHGDDIGRLVYGDPDGVKPANDSLMYLLFNTYHTGSASGSTKGEPVWKLTPEAIADNKIPADIVEKYNKGISGPQSEWYLTLKLCQDYEFMICIEPILYTDIRYEGGQFSGVVLYGTPTSISQGIEKLVKSGELNSDNYIHKGGWDVSLFKASKHSLILSKTWEYASDADKAADSNMVQRRYISNSNVKNNKYNVKNTELIGSLSDNEVEGYAMLLFRMLAQDKSHSWDKEKFPGGSGGSYEPHKAPDPTTDKFQSPKIPVGDPKLKHNIVKFYEIEQEISPGVTKVEPESTHIRNKTLAKIQIESEKEAGGYEVIEWKFSSDPIPAIKEGKAKEDGATAWDDPMIAGLNVKPENKSTESTLLSLVDITDKDNPDKPSTLYIRLRKEIKPPETHTLDNPGSPISPGSSPDPLAPHEHPEYTQSERDQLKFKIVKVYETKRIEVDGTETLILDGVFTRNDTAGIIEIEDESHTPSKYGVQDWLWSTDMDGTGSTWDEIKSSVSPVLGSGEGPDIVDIRNKDDIYEPRVNAQPCVR